MPTREELNELRKEGYEEALNNESYISRSEKESTVDDLVWNVLTLGIKGAVDDYINGDERKMRDEAHKEGFEAGKDERERLLNKD